MGGYILFRAMALENEKQAQASHRPFSSDSSERQPPCSV